MPARSILLVDDDEGMVETLGDILDARRYRVATARSGDDAINMTCDSEYDVVLMDIQMPGTNGVQALRELKARGVGAPIIMMTAYTRDELSREAERMTGFPVLAKPLDLERVLALLDELPRRDRAGTTG